MDQHRENRSGKSNAAYQAFGRRQLRPGRTRGPDTNAHGIVGFASNRDERDAEKRGHEQDRVFAIRDTWIHVLELQHPLANADALGEPT
jgi:hypothetical protein